MALDITLLFKVLLSTIVDGGLYPMEAYNRVLKAAVYGTVKLHAHNTDTTLLRTVCFIPEERKLLLFL